MTVSEPDLQALSEADVLAALVNPAPENRIAAEVIRLAEMYKKRFLNEMEKWGYIPPHVLHVKARWPIEAVAIKRARIGVTDDLRVLR
ncbi:MAG: hypothetical protein ACAH83_03530 [Alphaproteobacteria bacterium]